MLPEQLDTERIAGLYSYWSGGRDTIPADRKIGKAVARSWPAIPRMLIAAREAHAAEAKRASDRGMNVIICGAGYPADPEPHMYKGQQLPARFVFADASAKITDINEYRRGCAPGVAAVCADATSPARLAALPEVEPLIEAGPVQVQLHLLGHWWPGPLFAGILAGYGRVLPSGSEIVMTLLVTRDGQQWPHVYAAMLKGHTGVAPVAHMTGQLRGWCVRAGLDLDWPLANVQDEGPRGPEPLPPAWTVLAVARVP